MGLTERESEAYFNDYEPYASKALRSWLDKTIHREPFPVSTRYVADVIRILCPGAGVGPGVPTLIIFMLSKLPSCIKIEVTLVDVAECRGTLKLINDKLNPKEKDRVTLQYMIGDLTVFLRGEEENKYHVVFLEHPEVMWALAPFVPRVKSYRHAFAELSRVLAPQSMAIGACHYPWELADLSGLVELLGYQPQLQYALPKWKSNYSNCLFAQGRRSPMPARSVLAQLNHERLMAFLFICLSLVFLDVCKDYKPALSAMSMQADDWASLGVLLLNFASIGNVVGAGDRGIRNQFKLVIARSVLCLVQWYCAPVSQDGFRDGTCVEPRDETYACP
jgi:hypothetical protein